ncbi:carbohydrate kinase [Echinicola jeungdonensis]|uniref:Carbohydrate kinase n=1 Tax=Echinicola jeungdonensis TaxID=709343 RepID=A0ABV5J2A4_9BACT|nr:carbohydrate kinase [Echinicola jeungdonensis]MDN3667952.1 carbohydrate kinase [Echinicola jeungdonensis]
MKKKVVIFGEMLWDCFSDKNLPGGAPMNVALHAQFLGLETNFISAVGEDILGKDLLQFVAKKSLNTTYIQELTDKPTGKVLVDDSDRENVKYEIMKPVAWDFIRWNTAVQTLVEKADAFVFGSLAARSDESRSTLLRLLETTALKILDINLRAPHYDFGVLKQLLDKTDVLKINEEELEILAEFEGISPDWEEAVKKLTERYDLKMVCITRGAQGALIYDGEKSYQHPGFKVKVTDTVGSGDAFLSGFVYKYLQGAQPNEILDFACALGAFVATNQGGTPKYDMENVQAIIKGVT